MDIRVLEVTGIAAALYGLGLSYGKTKAVTYNQFKIQVDCLMEYPHLLDSTDKALEIGQAMVNRADANATMEKGHNKFLESIKVQLLITAPRMWWQEFDTYRLCSKQSDSTMHTLVGDSKNIGKVMTDEILINDSSVTDDNRHIYNYHLKQLKHLYAMVQLYCDGINSSVLPKTVKKQMLKHAVVETFPNTRQVSLDYKSLRNIYQQRCTHELPHWQVLCEHIRQLPFCNWITGGNGG